MKEIFSPLTEETLKNLRAGDQAAITGVLYAARDAAHKRMVDALDRGEAMPFEPQGQIIYYVGPTPPRPGQVIGSAGPTTSKRMDGFTPRILETGIKGTIGKGSRGKEVREAMLRHGAVYFGAIGGAGALLSRHIVKAEVIAYEDLGPEAIRRLEVRQFPVIVVNDIYGRDIFEEGRATYRSEATG